MSIISLAGPVFYFLVFPQQDMEIKLYFLTSMIHTNPHPPTSPPPLSVSETFLHALHIHQGPDQDGKAESGP